MDAASVESHLRMTPATQGVFSASGSVARFVPRSAWTRGAAIEVSLDGGSRSARGLPMLGGMTWRFTIGAPRIAYLAQVSGPANVWAIPFDGGDSAQITREPRGVLDFAPSPDGTRLAYSASREDGGADLKMVNADGSGASDLLACPGDLCRATQWSRDATRIAFERRSLTSAATVGEPHVWLLNLESGKATALPPEIDATSAPRWSPDGSRLAYYDSTGQTIVVSHAAAGESTLIADTSGEMGAWSPDAASLIFPDIVIGADQPGIAPTQIPGPTATPISEATNNPNAPTFYSHLVRVDLASRARQELSSEPLVEDAAASTAPDGGWIAFGRKYLDAPRWTPGRQLWLMRPDGSNAHPLTADGDYQHSAFVWSPDGRRLVFTRFNLATPGSPTEIWTISTDGNDARKLVDGGYLPAWLP
ncbi:MAG: PD40 domain-containing protein [Chloroflexi bacterium]|nr:PD40 domain-containing protein [Chloroflexota bacterium]